MTTRNINLGATCTQLAIQLEKALNQNGEVLPVYILIDRLVDNVYRLPPDVSVDLARSIFFPFGTRSLDHASLVLACKMVKLMNWWLKAKPMDTPPKPVLELIRERRIVVSAKRPDGRVLS
ncbi:unnamed protein product, partial [Rotaria sp. Silwood2]